MSPKTRGHFTHAQTVCTRPSFHGLVARLSTFSVEYGLILESIGQTRVIINVITVKEQVNKHDCETTCIASEVFAGAHTVRYL